MNTNNRGITELVVLIIVSLVVVAVAAFFLLPGNDSSLVDFGGARPTPTPSTEEVMEIGEQEVSEDDDLETLEAELEDTIVGEPTEDIEALEDDASLL